MTHGILGYGEIGQALAKLYTEPKVKDLNRDDGLTGIETLHVCIPYSEKFVDIVVQEITMYKPTLTIIHSTLAVHTTQTIQHLVPQDCYVVHSPIRGVHPNLIESILTFTKYVGSDYPTGAKMAKKALEEIGCTVKILKNSATTELGKLLSTTYYALCIAWHGEMQKMCDAIGVPYDEAITDFNQTYNAGYSILDKLSVIRPTLQPPQKTEGIGGHCLIPNTKILNELFESKILDLILDYEETTKDN